MPRTLPQSTINALKSESVAALVFIRIETPSSTVRLTSASGAVTFKGEVYLPATFGEVSNVTEDGDMSTSGIGFSMSGLEYSLLQLASESSFLNSPVSIWAQFEGDNDTGEMLLFEGFTSGAPSINFGNDCSILVTCQGKFAALNRPRSLRYTDAQQRERFPDDKGMEYAAQVSTREIIWPSAQWFKNNG